jgi:hypothetical protein
MGGAELILGPVVLLTGVLAGVILGVDTVNVLEPVTVTASMEQRGLSSEVVTHRLITRLAQIADLESEFHEIGGKDMAGEGFTESLAEAVGIAEIVLAARRLPGSVEAEFRPEFVERGDGTILRLRILRPQTGVHLVHEIKDPRPKGRGIAEVSQAPARSERDVGFAGASDERRKRRGM